jgi:hypothetical protein
MTDKAALLRAYHDAISKASHPLHLVDAWLQVRNAHRDRVRGQGSPAACDEALARALREIGT